MIVRVLPLLNEARAAILARVSDECLCEYYPLSFAAVRLRLAALSASPAAASSP